MEVQQKEFDLEKFEVFEMDFGISFNMKLDHHTRRK